MIEQSESGLNSAQYQVFQTSQTNYTYRVELHRYDPDFSLFFENDLGVHGSDYAADANATHLIRVHGSGAYEILTTTVVDGMHAFSFGAPKSVSLRHAGGVWYWYMAGAFGVYRCTSSNNGASWTAWTQVRSEPTELVAAVDTRYFTVITNAVGNGIVQWFTPANPTGATELVFSAVPRSIDALLWEGRALLVMAIDIPGRTTMTVEGVTPVRHITRSGGILAFRATDTNISEEIEVDIVDKYTVFRYREAVRLSALNGKVVVTCAASDGNEVVNYRSYRYYTSADGEYWSRGKILHEFPSSLQRPLTLLLRGNTVYALNRREIYQSPATYMTGTSTVVHDITSRVLAYQTQQADMRQSSLVVSNEDDFFAPLMADYHTWLVVTQLGFHGVGLLQTAVEEIDSWQEEIGIRGPEYIRAVRISCRDFTARLTDDAVAEEPKYWQAQLAGADAFVDNTGSGYGGMAHTATQAGSWRTEDNTLLLVANNEEGVAFSTFNSALWNGSVEYGVRLSLADNREYAGVCFRALDKDNLWAAWYDQQSDRIHLIRRMNGTNSLVAQSATLGWTTAILSSWRYIRAVFRYANIWVDVSSDAAAWQRVIAYTVPGNRIIAGESEPVYDRFIERGFVGCIGRGYSTMDYWYTPGYTATIQFVDWQPRQIRDDIASVVPESTTQRVQMLAWVDRGTPRRVYHAALDSGPPRAITLTDITPPATLLDEVGDLYEIFLAPWNARHGYLFCRKGILKTTDLWAAAPVWTLACTYDPIPYGIGFDITGVQPENVAVSPKAVPGRRGFWVWSAANRLYITTDEFRTIAVRDLEFTPYCIALGPYNRGRRGDGYIAAGGMKPGLYRTRDWFRTISLELDTVVDGSETVKPELWTWVEIPRTLANGRPNRRHRHVTGSCADRRNFGVAEYPLPSGWWRRTFDLRATMNEPDGQWVHRIEAHHHDVAFADYWYAGLGKRSAPGRINTTQNNNRFNFTTSYTLHPQTIRLRVIYTQNMVPTAAGNRGMALKGTQASVGVPNEAISASGNGSNLEWVITQYFAQTSVLVHLDIAINPSIAYWSGSNNGVTFIHMVMIEGDGPPPNSFPLSSPSTSGSEDVWKVYTFDLYLSPYLQTVSPSVNAADDMVLPIHYRHARVSVVRGNRRGWLVTSFDNLLESDNWRSDDARINLHWMHTTTAKPLGDWTGKKPIYNVDSTYLTEASNIFGAPNNTDFMGVFWRPSDDRKATSPGAPGAVRFYVTTDNWSSYEDWSSALATAYGGSPPMIWSVVSNVISITTDAPDAVETFVDDDLPYTPVQDWLDDTPGFGVWVPGRETCLQFSRARVYDRAPARTAEDIFRCYAGFAGIERYKFQSLLTPASTTVVASGVTIYQPALPHNYRLTFETSALASATVYLNLRAPDATGLTQVHYRLQFAPTVRLSKYIPSSGYTSVWVSPLAPSGSRVTVSVREIVMRSIGDNIWLVISVYVDDKLLETYMEWIRQSPETDYHVGVAGAHSAIRVPQLCEIVEWNAQDPGVPVMSGLNRAIEGRDIRFFMRFNGALSAWRQYPRGAVLSLQASDIDALQRAVDHRARVTHLRMVGAYLEAEIIRDGRGRHRFVEVKNPYLMTHRECYREAARALNRYDQALNTAIMTSSVRPLLEIGDRVDVMGEAYYIDGVMLNITPAHIESTYQLKWYGGIS